MVDDTIASRLERLGIQLPPEPVMPANIEIPFKWVRISGRRALISGHTPLLPDGRIAGPLGRVGQEISLEEGYTAARNAAIAVLGSLKRALGDLERVSAWMSISGFLRAAPEFTKNSAVINGASDLIIQLYGKERGQHARTAIGVAELPLGSPVIIAAEVEIDGAGDTRT